MNWRVVGLGLLLAGCTEPPERPVPAPGLSTELRCPEARVNDTCVSNEELLRQLREASGGQGN